MTYNEVKNWQSELGFAAEGYLFFRDTEYPFLSHSSTSASSLYVWCVLRMRKNEKTEITAHANGEVDGVSVIL